MFLQWRCDGQLFVRCQKHEEEAWNTGIDRICIREVVIELCLK